MRAMLFFDGPVYVDALSRSLVRGTVDYGRLADWALQSVDATQLAGAHYYTGAPGAHEEPERRQLLSEVLDSMECEPGYFVHRFNRAATTTPCDHCGQNNTTVEEKMLHTSLVTDVVMLAVQDAYDVAVLFTNDERDPRCSSHSDPASARCVVERRACRAARRRLSTYNWRRLAKCSNVARSAEVSGGAVFDHDVDQQMVRELSAGPFWSGQGLCWRAPSSPLERPSDSRHARRARSRYSAWSRGPAEAYRSMGRQRFACVAV